MISEHEVREILKEVYDPELNKNIVDLQMVKNILIEANKVKLTIALTTMRCPMAEKIVDDIKKAIMYKTGITAVEVDLTEMTKEEMKQLFPKHPLAGIGKVKHFIAVGSGKGGVGKTTVAVNLATALSKEGLRVGLFDADVHGPNIPVMLGLSEKPGGEEGLIIPLEKFGLKIISIGFFTPEDQPVIWRGPLVSKVITQFLDDVMWRELDYLVIDLPPGTGDVSITVAQSIPRVSLVIVTTPQEVALADVRRAINMFREMDTVLLGIVENMSYFKCGHNEERIEIFGKGGGESLSKEMDIPLLASIPIDLELRKWGDEGVPVVEASPDSGTAILFREIARKVIALSER